MCINPQSARWNSANLLNDFGFKIRFPCQFQSLRLRHAHFRNGAGVWPPAFIAGIGMFAVLPYAIYAAGYANAELASGQVRVPGAEKARANYDGLTRTERVTSAATWRQAVADLRILERSTLDANCPGYWRAGETI